MLPNMEPKIFSLSAVIVGYLLIDDLTANEQNALGNWLMLVAQVLCTNAFYKQVLSERKIKNSINEEELLQKFVEILGSNYVDKKVHIDKNIITACGAGQTFNFSFEILRQLGINPENIKKSMQI